MSYSFSVKFTPKSEQIDQYLDTIPVSTESDFNLIITALEALLNKQPRVDLPPTLKERIEPLRDLYDQSEEGPFKEVLRNRIAARVEQLKAIPSAAKAANVSEQQRLPVIVTSGALYENCLKLLKNDNIKVTIYEKTAPQRSGNCAYRFRAIDEVDTVLDTTLKQINYTIGPDPVLSKHNDMLMSLMQQMLEESDFDTTKITPEKIAELRRKCDKYKAKCKKEDESHQVFDPRKEITFAGFSGTLPRVVNPVQTEAQQQVELQKEEPEEKEDLPIVQLP